jgi:hypothetical protein
VLYSVASVNWRAEKMAMTDLISHDQHCAMIAPLHKISDTNQSTHQLDGLETLTVNFPLSLIQEAQSSRCSQK